MRIARILGLGLALALTGCGSDEATGDETGGTTGGETGGTTGGETGGTTGGETGGNEVTFTVGSYAVESQRSFSTEACEGEAQPSESEGSFTFHFEEGSVMRVSFQVCVLEDGVSTAITDEACQAEGGVWYTDELAGTWSTEGTTVDITVVQEDEEGNTETDNLSCSVQSAEAITCYGIETEETVDLEGNVIESEDRCLELSLTLIAD